MRLIEKCLTVAATTTTKVTLKDCDEYLLVEERVHCGPHGYPLRFGYKNCRNFLHPDTRKRFSAAGRKFLECSTSCLLDSIDEISKATDSCEDLREQAFDSHIDCYYTCDFCDICRTQKAALIRSYDWGDFLSFAAVKQVVTIAQKCGLFNCLF